MFIFDLFEAAQPQQTLVIIPGGYHPFHPGHLSLYKSAQKAFPNATIVYAATDDRKERPFAFDDKAKLAAIAGVPQGHFQLVRSPFVAKEITQNFDPNTTALVFVRSEKDRNEQPQAGTIKKDGSPSYLQPLPKGALAPMSQHGYMAYLPVVQFDAGPSGVTSATQIREMWPNASPAQKAEIVQDLYPKNPQVAQQILDKYLGQGVAEGYDDEEHKTQGEEHNVRRVDMTGKECEKCHKGDYQETGVQDDMHGVLHCTNCGKQTDRWKMYRRKGVAEGSETTYEIRLRKDGGDKLVAKNVPKNQMRAKLQSLSKKYGIAVGEFEYFKTGELKEQGVAEGIFDRFKKKAPQPQVADPGNYPRIGSDIAQWMAATVEYHKAKHPDSLWKLFCPSYPDYLPTRVRVGTSEKTIRAHLEDYVQLRDANPEAKKLARQKFEPNHIYPNGPREDYPQQGMEEGIGSDMAKLGGIAALGVGGALVGNYSDTQQPKVEIGGQVAFVEPSHVNVPDNAMTLTGKDGKTYCVWSTKGTAQSSKRYHAVPVKQVKEQAVAKTIYPNAEVIKSKNGKPIGEIYQDASGWGCFHYNADNGADCIASREEALEWLKDLADEYRQDQRLREGNAQDPNAVQLNRRARHAHPLAQSDEEALALYVNDREIKDVDRLEYEQNKERRVLDRISQGEQDLEQHLQNLEAELASLVHKIGAK